MVSIVGLHAQFWPLGAPAFGHQLNQPPLVGCGRHPTRAYEGMREQTDSLERGRRTMMTHRPLLVWLVHMLLMHPFPSMIHQTRVGGASAILRWRGGGAPIPKISFRAGSLMRGGGGGHGLGGGL